MSQNLYKTVALPAISLFRRKYVGLYGIGTGFGCIMTSIWISLPFMFIFGWTVGQVVQVLALAVFFYKHRTYAHNLRKANGMVK